MPLLLMWEIDFDSVITKIIKQKKYENNRF